MPQAKVQKACQRCRQQKLRCDAQRPCVLCSRAGAECLDPLPKTWKPYEPGSNKRPSPSSSSAIKRSRRGGGVSKALDPVTRAPFEKSRDSVSSSVSALVQEALRVRSGHATANLAAPAIPGSQDGASETAQGCEQAILQEVIACLPTVEVVELLVDTYFDRVHWFLLVFHQDAFRSRVQGLLRSNSQQPLASTQSLPFVASVVAVVLIGLQYSGDFRQQKLISLGADAPRLRDKLQGILKQHFLDLVAICSLESVQMCVLLGTYLLFHGEPATAWPVVSTGVSAAKAIKLDRVSSAKDQTDAQARSRCWWALYEVETFCTMSYGYNSSMCNIQSTMPLPGAVSLGGSDRLRDYKTFMASLSVIISTTLETLYGRCEKELGPTVADLSRQLEDWYHHLPEHLRNPPQAPTYSTAFDLDCDVAASGPKFENHLFQLQSLALKLAYDNTKILIHRPLLSASSSRNGKAAIQACKTAALSTSRIGSLPILPLAAQSYAVAFIGMHLFTAGVVFGIVGKRDPLGPDASEVKTGMRDLIKTQSLLLQAKSNAVTAQSLDILKNLAKSLIDSELEAMLGEDGAAPSSTIAVKEGIASDSNVQSSEETSSVPGVDITMPNSGLQDIDQSWLMDDTFFSQEQAWLWDLDFEMPA